MKSFFKKVYIWPLLIILTVPTFYSLVRSGYFPIQDNMQAFRIEQMDKCLQDGQIPCRWVPDMGYQYGYPQFEFYSPSVYYLGNLFHFAGFQFIDSIKILFILGFVTGTLTMFIFIRTLFGDWPALVGAVLYTYVPFKAVDVYVRGAMSEFWALAIFPLVFWSSYQLIKTEKVRYLVWLALSAGALLLTHNLMSLIFLPLVAIWSLAWVYLEKDWKVLPKLITGGILGAGLAAFFILPLIFERQYVHIETMLGGYFDYRQHFVTFGQLFFSNYWGYGSSVLGPNDDLSLSTGIVQWIAGVIALFVAILSFKRFQKVAMITFILVLVDISVLFLTHQKSSFIWERIPFLAWLQFPWRLLADSIFLLSFLGGLAVFLTEKLKGRKFSTALGIILIIGVFVLYGSFFRPLKWFNFSDQQQFSGDFWEKQLTSSIFDYLPVYAKLPPNNKAPAYPEVLKGKVDFQNYKKGSDFQIGGVHVTQDALIRLPLFDFPGMTVTIDGKVVDHNHNNCSEEEYCLGLISFNVPTGNHIIKASLENTPIRTVGNILTIVSFLVLTGLIFKAKIYERINR
ncbi:MAG: hypothetical protein M1142_06800 [Patescibacteria group bacterium]|nr:hypothetical protein [Patescibacteria group bacterium]